MPKPPGLGMTLVPRQTLETTILITPKLRRSRNDRSPATAPAMPPWKKPRR